MVPLTVPPVVTIETPVPTGSGVVAHRSRRFDVRIQVELEDITVIEAGEVIPEDELATAERRGGSAGRAGLAECAAIGQRDKRE